MVQVTVCNVKGVKKKQSPISAVNPSYRECCSVFWLVVLVLQTPTLLFWFILTRHQLKSLYTVCRQQKADGLS